MAKALTRQWLIDHGWKPTKDFPTFHRESECIDADLCVIINHKEYIIAKFHYMGSDAWEPTSSPDSFEFIGINNQVELLDYDFKKFVLAAYVCNLTGIERINLCIGGLYDITTTRI